MRILIIAPPLLKREKDESSQIVIPPYGYGGIEIVVHNLISGLVANGCSITLIGAPGSFSYFNLTVIREVRQAEDIRRWIILHHKEFDVIHDHSCGLIFDNTYQLAMGIPYISTHHKTGLPDYPRNTVFLSEAQRQQAKSLHSPIIRIPILFDNYLYNQHKEDYFLYLGRVSEWKGVKEAAKFCQKLSMKLIIAGPSWEEHYLTDLLNSNSTAVYVGEVGGLKKLDLLAKAKALFVLSRFSFGPWGDNWCEPGSTVVGEAAASGTPIVSSTNGCLKEIVVPDVGIQLDESEILNLDVTKIEKGLPESEKIIQYARENWDHTQISKQYIELYEKTINGFCW